MFRTKAITRLFANSVKLLVDNSGLNSRNLYAPATLGIDDFLSAREKTKVRINNLDNFRSKMKQFVSEENSKNMIFTEDLKNMVHVSEKGDLELLTQMVEQFCSQSKETRFGNFIFGPPIMRLLYHLNDPDTALKLFKNENLSGFFDQLATYRILLDLLFNQGRYQDVLDTFEVIQARQVQGGRSKHVYCLTMASCYKLNSKESFEHAKKIWADALASGHAPMRRTVTFFATLALNQGEPQIAMEVLSNQRQQNYLTVRSIKVLALAKLKRFDDVVPILRAVLEIENPLADKQTFPFDVIEQLKLDFGDNKSKTLQQDFEKVVGFLEKHGHVSKDSLGEILCTPIAENQEFQPREGFQKREGFYGGNQQQERRPFQRYQRREQRPGLHELY